MKGSIGFLVLSLCVLLCGCGAHQSPEQKQILCRVALEETEGVVCAEPVQEVTRGADAVFSLKTKPGSMVTGTDYPDWELEEDGEALILRLKQVEYTEMVTLKTRQEGRVVLYDANGGIGPHGEVERTDYVLPNHLRCNTAPVDGFFTREGYTQIGWSISPDGAPLIGGGSRTVWTEKMKLYAVWSPWTPETDFQWEQDNGSAVITAYWGEEETVTVPQTLGGLPVRRIGASAFENASCERIILPSGLREVETDAFRGSSVQELWLCDDLIRIPDQAFRDCGSLQTLHINAVTAPVYSGSYYDTFSDKYDRLLSLCGQRKIILFSGSSTRFGYDSARLEKAFPDYQVVNMGVFAYTNAYPQLLLILDGAENGDILIHAPEFDTAKRQFCSSDSLDAAFFAMMESNYDMVTGLDLREVTGVFAAFTAYQDARSAMTERGYGECASDYDEDGNPSREPTYNQYGDYIAYRPNAESDDPVYGLEVDYTVHGFPQDLMIEPLNAVYQRFLDQGISVYFTYAPRNRLALSADSIPEKRKELDEYFRDKLIVPVISDLEESLYPGHLLNGTDNHLSTEGVQLRTERVINDLRRELEKEGKTFD